MLDNLTDVERVLYQTHHTLARQLFVIAGPSGVGKNTIIRELLANHPEMDRVRTYTTRKPRPGEVEGEQYHFVTWEKFCELARAGKLMEVDTNSIGQDVYGLGKVYSMPADIYEGIPPERHIVIAEVDVVGTRRLRARYPDCVTIFVTAPPLDLIQRIRERRDETMDARSLTQRMQTARDQIRAAKEFDYVIFNRDGHLREALQAVEAIIQVTRMHVRQGFDLEAMIPPDAFQMLESSSS